METLHRTGIFSIFIFPNKPFPDFNMSQPPWILEIFLVNAWCLMYAWWFMAQMALLALLLELILDILGVCLPIPTVTNQRWRQLVTVGVGKQTPKRPKMNPEKGSGMQIGSQKTQDEPKKGSLESKMTHWKLKAAPHNSLCCESARGWPTRVMPLWNVRHGFFTWVWHVRDGFFIWVWNVWDGFLFGSHPPPPVWLWGVQIDATIRKICIRIFFEF